MPYSRKRKYPYRSSRYRRSGYRAKRYRGLTPTYRGYGGPQQLRAEWKFVDVTTNDISPAIDGGNPINLTAIAQGNGPSERIGMKIAVRSIELRLISIQKADTIPGALRFSIVQDRQTNGELAPFTTVYSYAGINTHRNLGQRRRFKILRDKSYPVQRHDVGNNVIPVHWYIKFRKPISVEYNGGTSNSINAIASNSINMYFVGTWTVATSTPILGFTSRIRYTDV